MADDGTTYSGSPLLDMLGRFRRLHPFVDLAGYRAMSPVDQETARRNALANCVATPDEMIRTAVRLLLLTAHSGLGAAPTDVRQSEEARKASQALYAAGEFFNSSAYDTKQVCAELLRLCDALVPLAAVHRCDPFMLHLYATGKLRRRKKPAAGVTTLRDR